MEKIFKVQVLPNRGWYSPKTTLSLFRTFLSFKFELLGCWDERCELRGVGGTIYRGGGVNKTNWSGPNSESTFRHAWIFGVYRLNVRCTIWHIVSTHEQYYATHDWTLVWEMVERSAKGKILEHDFMVFFKSLVFILNNWSCFIFEWLLVIGYNILPFL